MEDQKRKASKKSSSSVIPFLGFVGSAFCSSSCCLIQVLLNALSLSCAGFKVLTPYKRVWWMMNCVFGWIWWRKSKRTSGTKGMILLALATISLSEEMLSFANVGGLQRNLDGNSKERGSMMELGFTVQKMDCPACAAKIRQGVVKEFSEGSVTCTADPETKTLIVKAAGETKLDPARIIEAIGKIGYTAQELKDAEVLDGAEL